MDEPAPSGRLLFGQMFATVGTCVGKDRHSTEYYAGSICWGALFRLVVRRHSFYHSRMPCADSALLLLPTVLDDKVQLLCAESAGAGR